MVGWLLVHTYTSVRKKEREKGEEKPMCDGCRWVIQIQVIFDFIVPQYIQQQFFDGLFHIIGFIDVSTLMNQL